MARLHTSNTWLFLLTMAVLLGGDRGAHAQYMKNEIVLGAGAGLQFPTGSFSDLVDGDHSLYLTADMVLDPSWAVGIRAAYQTFDPADDNSSVRRVRYLSGDLQARLYLYPESWFTPYAVGGAGLYAERTWTGSGANEATGDRTLGALTGGFGFSAHRQGRRPSLFTEVLYHHLLTSQSRQFVQWSAGLRISFGGRPF